MQNFSSYTVLKTLRAWVCLITLSLLYAGAAQAQSPLPGEGQGSLSAPALPAGITAAKIASQIEAINADSSLEEPAKKAALDYYKMAGERLSLAAERRAQVTALKAQNDTSDIQLRRLNDDLEAALARLETPIKALSGPMTDDALFQMEQELRAYEGEAEALRDEIKNLDARAAALSGRIQAARAERIDVAKRLDDVSAQIAGFSGAAEGLSEQALRTSLLVRRYAREWEVRALDAEIANIPVQERLVLPARDLAGAKLQDVVRRIQVLRDLTGEQRLAEATARLTQSREDVALTSESHPAVMAYADQNLTYAQRLLEIAKAGGNSSVIEARVNGQIKRLSEDNLLARQILAEGNLDRQYGAVLRRLRANVPDRDGIVREVESRTKAKLDISMQRILAQDKLKEFPLSGPKIEDVLADWQKEVPASPALSEADAEALGSLLTKQRALLGEIVTNANRKVEKLVLLNSLQQNLMTEMDELTGLLDQQLIWLPSTEVISLSWPMRVIEGLQVLLRPTNFLSARDALIKGLAGNVLWIALAMLLLAGNLYVKPRLMAQVGTMRDTVGRVKEDDHWSTPIAVLAGILQVTPIALLIGLPGYLIFAGAETSFAGRLGRAVMIASLIWLILLTVRTWSRDGRLFDLHFKVKKPLRDRIAGNMVWLAAMQTIAIVTMTLCEDYAGESPTAGLGLLGFMIGAVSLAVFAYRVLWKTRQSGQEYLKPNTFIARHRESIFWISVAIPVLITLLAMGGYFATAVEIQTRLMITAVLLLGAYITYGVVRRTVEVSERRLALQAARERRAAALKEREKREEAEERGEAVVSSLDYEQINLESISRQSTQLLNIIGVILFSGLAWILWSDLLPALSIFDRVELPFNTSALNADGDRVTVPATLWDLIQAIFVGTLAFLAAKTCRAFWIFSCLNAPA